MAKRAAPEVNAGSMADIAFLLLIFFLVTTTIEKDKGILRSLPPIDDVEQPEDVIIKQKNLFVVLLNKHDQLLVEDNEMQIKDLRQAAIDFLDNGGGTDASGNRCDYCQGKKDPASSDHPDKAIISLQHDRETSYGKYIEVQNELVAAYNVLRDREAQKEYNMTFAEMLELKENSKFKKKDKSLDDKIDAIKKKYPQKLSEAEPQSN